MDNIQTIVKTATTHLKVQDYKTPIWKIVMPLEMSPFNITCEVLEKGQTKYPEDGSAQDLEREIWNYGVDKKVKQLLDEGFEIQLKEEDGRKSLLYKKPGQTKFERVMTPGVQYRFVDINPLEGVLSLEQTLYSEVEALKFKDYRDIFREQGLPVPYGPIAPVLLITTFNGWLLASERSTDTNKFPGSEWGFGGDVDNPSKNIGEHLVFVEKRQELHSKKGEATYETVGIIFDEVLHKHDLVVHATYREGPNNIKKGDRLLPDVANINIHSVREDDLANYLVDSYVHSLDHANQAWIGKPSSAFSADILLFGWQKYGSLWADAVMDKINAKIAELPEPMEVPWQEY